MKFARNAADGATELSHGLRPKGLRLIGFIFCIWCSSTFAKEGKVSLGAAGWLTISPLGGWTASYDQGSARLVSPSGGEVMVSSFPRHGAGGVMSDKLAKELAERVFRAAMSGSPTDLQIRDVEVPAALANIFERQIKGGGSSMVFDEEVKYSGVVFIGSASIVVVVGSVDSVVLDALVASLKNEPPEPTGD